jgi:mono/diheme cytochrome c family protein
MIMKVKSITIGTVALALTLGMLVVAGARPEVQPADTAAFYKSKCVMCHGKKAEKKFDTTLTDDQMVEVVLKGKKAEKPPHMPAYSEKGVTAEQAKALVDHMKQLKAMP